MDAPGFVPNKIYDFHDLDSVNTYNGNLIVSVPIGPAFHLNGKLSYGLALHYNSHLWHYWIEMNYGATGEDPGGCDLGLLDPKWRCHAQYAEPSQRANAALGWTLSLGRLLGPGDPLNTINDSGNGTAWGGGFVYEDPDGATHPFFFPSGGGALDTTLTKDGSYMRRRQSSDQVHVYVESRDGITRQFDYKAGALT